VTSWRDGELDEDAELELFRRLPDPATRDLLAGHYLWLAEQLAGRFAGRGEARDDLVQVASLGLMHAIDRFDPERGVHFQAFASVTIVGELRRHFRDKGWSIRVPRSLQEASLAINRTLASLWQELGRSPTVAELAEATDLSEETVLEAMDAVQAYSTASLDAPVGEEGAASLGELVGDADPSFEVSDEWMAIAPALAELPMRERRILYLRFFKDMTQTEIAKEVGISQMHVSRLLGQALAKVREAAGRAGSPQEDLGAP
jgi:RNA polymerase sigma-B factor